MMISLMNLELKKPLRVKNIKLKLIKSVQNKNFNYSFIKERNINLRIDAPKVVY